MSKKGTKYSRGKVTAYGDIEEALVPIQGQGSRKSESCQVRGTKAEIKENTETWMKKKS